MLTTKVEIKKDVLINGLIKKLNQLSMFPVTSKQEMFETIKLLERVMESEYFVVTLELCDEEKESE